MSILDPHVQIKLAKMFDIMWSDYLESGPSEELEAYVDASGLTEEFECTQDDLDADETLECEVGDTLRRLNDDGSAVIRLADEANKQEREAQSKGQE